MPKDLQPDVEDVSVAPGPEPQDLLPGRKVSGAEHDDDQPRCGAPGPNGWKCVRKPGHPLEEDHGYAGCFWPQEITVPPCENHAERQHRDGNPPWCNTCGWNRGRPAILPRQYKEIR